MDNYQSGSQLTQNNDNDVKASQHIMQSFIVHCGQQSKNFKTQR